MQKSYPLFDMMAGVDLPGIFWNVRTSFSLLLSCSVSFAAGSIFFYNHELLKRGIWKKERPIWLAGFYTGM
ncbi:MAG: hypothetical protein ACLRMZ_27540 [Blautia marasmi]